MTLHGHKPRSYLPSSVRLKPDHSWFILATSAPLVIEIFCHAPNRRADIAMSSTCTTAPDIAAGARSAIWGQGSFRRMFLRVTKVAFSSAALRLRRRCGFFDWWLLRKSCAALCSVCCGLLFSCQLFCNAGVLPSCGTGFLERNRRLAFLLGESLAFVIIIKPGLELIGTSLWRSWHFAEICQ